LNWSVFGWSASIFFPATTASSSVATGTSSP
jgi:hypothetical protein